MPFTRTIIAQQPRPFTDRAGTVGEPLLLISHRSEPLASQRLRLATPARGAESAMCSSKWFDDMPNRSSPLHAIRGVEQFRVEDEVRSSMILIATSGIVESAQQTEHPLTLTEDFANGMRSAGIFLRTVCAALCFFANGNAVRDSPLPSRAYRPPARVSAGHQRCWARRHAASEDFAEVAKFAILAGGLGGWYGASRLGAVGIC